MPSEPDFFHAEMEALCAAQPAWSRALGDYAAFHRAALAELEAAAAVAVDASGGARLVPPLLSLPNVTIYRVLPYQSHIGWGDILPGVASALLSSMRRRRVFLLDWRVGADDGIPGSVVSYLGAPFNASYPGGAEALSRGRPTAQWHEARAVPAGSALPALWGRAASRSHAAAVEVFTHLNRGVFTQELWQQTAAERAWLQGVLPVRAEDGALLYGCVYRAAAPLSAALRAAAAGVAPPGLGRAAAAARAHARALRAAAAADEGDAAAAPPAAATPLICVQVRTGVQIDPPEILGAAHNRDAEHWATRPFDCAEQALAAMGNESTALLVVTDDARVRALATTRFGARVQTTGVAPKHMGFLEGAGGDGEVARAYTSSLADWLLLSSCGYIVKDMNTGFSRTAGVHAADAVWLWANEKALGFVQEPMAAPCRATVGASRQAWSHLPAGW